MHWPKQNSKRSRLVDNFHRITADGRSMKIDNLVAELFRKNDLNNSQEASKAKLQRKNQSGNEGQKASGKEQQVFSYISLLGRQTESFPHRTQPIIDGGGRRKSSSSQSLVEVNKARGFGLATAFCFLFFHVFDA